MALKAEVWDEAVTEGGRRLLASRRIEEEDATRYRQEKREGNETGKVVFAHGSVEFCEATPIGLATCQRNPCKDARRTETCVTSTCVAPRHVDASRDFYVIFSPNEQRGGGGGRCQT